MNQIRPIDDRLRQQITDHTLDYIARAGQLFGCELPPLPVLFDLRGRSSGMYRVRGRRREIRYNPWIFAAHFDHCFATTVPHEVAHYVVDHRFGLGNVRPHGKEWKAVMAAFGADPSVTASLSLEGVPQRRSTWYAYQCRCDDHHKLGVRRHRRVVRGEATYRCRRCGDTLQQVP